MILYAIRNKSNGRHFVHTNGRGDAYWNTQPVFFKTPDAIWKNLKRLCCEFYWEEYQIKDWSGKWVERKFRRKNWRKFDARKLKKYEVVQFSVKALGTTTIDAHKFVIPKKLAKMNVKIK